MYGRRHEILGYQEPRGWSLPAGKYNVLDRSFLVSVQSPGKFSETMPPKRACEIIMTD
jgi:hypothetical protein